MRYDYLESILTDVIKEEQIKLGFAEETIYLYYPLSSLCHILGTGEESVEIMTEALKGFSSLVKSRLGEVVVSSKGTRFCFKIPPEGVRYVHNCVPRNLFLEKFIEVFRNHNSTLEDILSVFYEFSEEFVCEAMKDAEFDYMIYFKNFQIDPHRYCIKFEGSHVTYHRYLSSDFTY